MKLNNMQEIDEEKIYFNAGDVVQLKQDIPYKPKMIVIKKITSIFKHDIKNERKSTLKGIKCMWFSEDGTYQEAVFNTKDLQIV